MTETPSPDWDAATFAEWLRPSFDWLATQWEEGEEPTPWEGVKPGFLGLVDVDASSLTSTPELRVLELFVWYVDEELRSEDERREFLLDADARELRIGGYVTQWNDEIAAAAGPADAEPETRYVEGYGLMRYDAEADEWVVVDPAPAAENVEATTPRDVSAEMVEAIVAPALRQLLAAMPELAGLAPGDLDGLVSSVVAERVASSV